MREKSDENSSGFSFFRRLALMLVALAATGGYPASSFGRVPITNDQNWRKYFTEKELAESEAAVGNSIKLLNEKGTDEAATLAEIASHGPLAIPALVKLCGQRQMGLIASSHEIPIPFPTYNPHCPRASGALMLISAPAARPRLFKISNDSFMGGAAMRTLLNIGGLSGEQLTAMFDAPRGIEYPGDELIQKRVGELSPDERAKLVIHMFRRIGFSRGGSNIGAEDPRTVQEFLERVNILANIPSRIAKDDLQNRALGYRRELNESLNTSRSEDRMNSYSDEGRRKIRENIKNLPSIISKVDNALARCTISLGDTAGIVAGPPITELDSELASADIYTLRFLVWSTSPTVKISALIQGIPVDDVRKKIWDLREVKLNRGEVYPFELPVNIRWVPIVKPNVGYPVTIEVYSDRRLIAKTAVYPGFVPGHPPQAPKNAPPPSPPTITLPQ